MATKSTKHPTPETPPNLPDNASEQSEVAYQDYKRLKRVLDEADKTGVLVCPNDPIPMELIEKAKYLVSSTQLATYCKWRCPTCGYELHQYLPLGEPGPNFPDDFPF